MEVSDGYARNMLLPRGYAVEATKGNIRNLEKVKAKQAEEEAQRKAEAQEKAEMISKLDVEIKTKSGEGGRLFGSITSKDIADALEAQHDIKVDKKKIKIETPIKNLGVYHVDIKLYTEINTSLTVKVVDQSNE